MLSLELPNKSKAHIPLRKLVDYLLSETHAIGKSKAKFFRAVGFSESTVGDLEEGLLDIAQTGQTRERVDSPYGTKYIVEGSLKTPSGAIVQVRTIWIVNRANNILGL